MRDRLFEVIKRHGLKFGQFELTSGSNSNFYFDIKSIALSPAGELLAEAIWNQIKEENIRSIGGAATGGIPLITLVCNFAWRTARTSLFGFYFKSNGQVIGSPKSEVIVIEDVVTTGNSIVRVAKSLDKVKLIVAVVDRRSEKSVTLQGYRFISLFQDQDFFEPLDNFSCAFSTFP